MKPIAVEKVFEIINAHFENIEIVPDNLNDDLFALGMDSLRFIKVVVSLENEFECEIPDSKLLIAEMDTVQKIINVLQTIYEEQSNQGLYN